MRDDRGNRISISSCHVPFPIGHRSIPIPDRGRPGPRSRDGRILACTTPPRVRILRRLCPLASIPDDDSTDMEVDPMRRLALPCLAALLLWASPTVRTAEAGMTYLALGDSLAFGEQQ